MGSIVQVLRLSNKLNAEEDDEDVSVQKVPIELFPVLFKRAVCIHSTLQFVDLFLQNLMFSHGFSTSPVIPRRDESSDDSELFSKTLMSFEKMRCEFREIFRSRHRTRLSEVAVFIGTCPLRSIYSYRVPISLCEAEDSTHDNCGDTCAELNDLERRKINRDLFMLSHTRSTPEYEKHLNNQNHRLFVFLKGSEEMVGDEIEEEDPPFDCKQCRQYTFSHENCNCEGVPMAPTEGKWLRMVPFIVHSKH